MTSNPTRTRNLLHYNKLSLFRIWCEGQGYETSSGAAEYEVMRLTGFQAAVIPPIIFYKRLKTDHVTTFGKGTELVERWLKERTMTTSLPSFYDMLSRHDWFYSMTESKQVYDRGAAAQALLEKIAKESPEHEKMFKNYHGSVWNFEDEQGNKYVKPEKPT